MSIFSWNNYFLHVLSMSLLLFVTFESSLGKVAIKSDRTAPAYALTVRSRSRSRALSPGAKRDEARPIVVAEFRKGFLAEVKKTQ